MSTKGGTDGQVRSYFSPYKSPQLAYDVFMRALEDMEKRVGNYSQVAVGGSA